MANNCYNYLTVTGKKEEIQQLAKLLKENDNGNGTINFEKVLNTTSKDYYESFGTRWMFADIEEYDDYLTISGDSAWSPALQFFSELTLKFESLQIEYDYEESGCDFGGWANIEQGEITDNCFGYWEYKFKRDYSFALEQAYDEIKYFVDDNLIEDLKEHDILLHIRDEDKAEIFKELNITL